MRNRFITSDEGTTGFITPNDLIILEIINFYGYLPSNYIVALYLIRTRKEEGGEYCRHRLTVLRHVLKVIYPPRASWAAANARYRPAVYALTPKGIRELKKQGLYVKRDHEHANLAHDLMAALVMASIEIGAHEHGLKLYTWQKLKSHAKPEAKGDYRFEVDIANGGSPQKHKIEPDWSPIALKAKTALYFYGVESDRRTEPTQREAMDQSSMVRKFAGFQHILANRLWERLGFENCFFLVVTVNTRHEKNMCEALVKHTDGRGSRGILLRTVPDFTSFENFPKPTGWALTPWRRAGFPDFDILGELHGSNETRQDSGAYRTEAQR